MCPDIINRYLSNVMTIDQIEALRNKTVDGAFNTFANIPTSAIGKIEDKTKLHDHIVYKDVPNQTLAQHVDVDFQGLQDGDKISYDAATQKWVNVQITEGGGTGDVIGGANIGEDGASIYYQENASHILEFSKLKSLDSALTIVNNGDAVELDIVDASTTQKGITMLATSGEEAATKAVVGTDTRLSNARAPTNHATNHKSGQTDVIKLDELGAPTDITTLNTNTSNHGLCPKLSGNATDVLKGDGSFGSIPAGGSTYKAKNLTEAVFGSSTSLQTVLQYSFAQNEMGTDKIFDVVVDGLYLNDSGSTSTLKIKASFGATVLFEKTSNGTDPTGNIRAFHFHGKWFNKGVANAQRFSAHAVLSNENNTTGGGYGDFNTDEMTGHTALSGSSALDTAAVTANVFKIEIQHSVNSGNTKLTRTLSYIKEE